MQKGEAARGGRRAALPIPTLTARRQPPRMLPIIEKHEPVPSDDGTMLVTLSDGRREWSVPVTVVRHRGRLASHVYRAARARGVDARRRAAQFRAPPAVAATAGGARRAPRRPPRAEGDAGARDAVVEEGEARDQVAAREVDVGAGVVRQPPRRRRRAAPPRDPARAHRPRRAHGGGARRRPRRRRRRRRRPRLRPRRLRRDHGRADRAAALPRRAPRRRRVRAARRGGADRRLRRRRAVRRRQRGLGRVRRRPPPPSSFEDLVGLDLCIGGAAARGVEPAAVVESPRSSPAPDEIPPPVAWPPAGAAAARGSGVRGRVAKWFAVAAAAASRRLALAVFVVVLAPAEASGVFYNRAELKAAVDGWVVNAGEVEATRGSIAGWDVSAVDDMSGTRRPRRMKDTFHSSDAATATCRIGARAR